MTLLQKCVAYKKQSSFSSKYVNMLSKDIQQLVFSLISIQQNLDTLQTLLNQTPDNTYRIVEEICSNDIKKCLQIFSEKQRP